jgi:hypothetical protein
MTCQSCHKVNIGQRGRNLTRHKESAFAQHILGQGHQYEPKEHIIEMLEYARKGNMLNIKENYSINLNNLMN